MARFRPGAKARASVSVTLWLGLGQGLLLGVGFGLCLMLGLELGLGLGLGLVCLKAILRFSILCLMLKNISGGKKIRLMPHLNGLK